MSVRVVRAAHGVNAAMGYRFRARIERRPHRGKTNQWRWVGEYHHMAWRDADIRGGWTTERDEAERGGNEWLDAKAATPGVEYVSA